MRPLLHCDCHRLLSKRLPNLGEVAILVVLESHLRRVMYEGKVSFCVSQDLVETVPRQGNWAGLLNHPQDVGVLLLYRVVPHSVLDLKSVVCSLGIIKNGNSSTF